MPQVKRFLFPLVIPLVFASLLVGGCTTSPVGTSKGTEHNTVATDKDAPDIKIYAVGKKFTPSPKLARKIEVLLRELLNNDYHASKGILTEDPIDRLKKEGIAVSYHGNLQGKKDIFVPLEWSANTIFFDGAQYYTNDKESTASFKDANGALKLPAKFDQDIAAIEQVIIESSDKSLQGLWRTTTEANETRLKLFIPSLKYQPLFYRAHMILENISQQSIKFDLSGDRSVQPFPFRVSLYNPDGSKSLATQYGSLTSSTTRKIDFKNRELVLQSGERLIAHATFLIESNYGLAGAEYPYQDIEATWLPRGIIRYDTQTESVEPLSVVIRTRSGQDGAKGFYYDPINPDKVKWITMEGGFGIKTKVLYRENAREKIDKIVGMINMGTRARPSRAEDNIGGMARPIGIKIQLDNGETRFIQFAYKVTESGNETCYKPYGDRFIVMGQRQNRYITLFSRNTGVIEYLRNGWQKDMPVVP